MAEVTRALKACRERLGFQDNQVSLGDQEQWGPRGSLYMAPQVVRGSPVPLASQATVDPVLLAYPAPLVPPDLPRDMAQ